MRTISSATFPIRVAPTASLEELQDHIIGTAQRGYPILIVGSAFFFALGAISTALPERSLGLVWVFGMMLIFPTGVLLGGLLGIKVITTDNPLGTLGGLVAAVQAFFIPVFIVVYQFVPQYLPATVGLLGGAHFLPYVSLARQQDVVASTHIGSSSGMSAARHQAVLDRRSRSTTGPLASTTSIHDGDDWLSLMRSGRRPRQDLSCP